MNLGDTYAGSNGVRWKETIENTNRKIGGDKENTCLKKNMGMKDLVPAKSLCCIPDRFKIAMVDDESMDEYELRNDLTKEEKEYVLTELTKRGII